MIVVFSEALAYEKTTCISEPRSYYRFNTKYLVSLMLGIFILNLLGLRIRHDLSHGV